MHTAQLDPLTSPPETVSLSPPCGLVSGLHLLSFSWEAQWCPSPLARPESLDLLSPVGFWRFWGPPQGRGGGRYQGRQVEALVRMPQRVLPGGCWGPTPCLSRILTPPGPESPALSTRSGLGPPPSPSCPKSGGQELGRPPSHVSPSSGKLRKHAGIEGATLRWNPALPPLVVHKWLPASGLRCLLCKRR